MCNLLTKTPKILPVKGLIRKSTTLHMHRIVFLHFKISKGQGVWGGSSPYKPLLSTPPPPLGPWASTCFESVHIDWFLSSHLVPAGCKKQEHLLNSYRNCSLVVFHLCTLHWKQITLPKRLLLEH